MRPQKDVLIVDDEPVILQAVGRVCSADGLTCDAAEDGLAAVRLLDERAYRLIICDIMMPGMDGFQLLSELARRRVTTPVIVASGFSTVQNAVRSLSHGAADFLPKPFTADELLGAVRRGLRYGPLQRRAASSRDAALPVFVPCPARYYRLGYSAWVAPEEGGTALVGVTDLLLKTIEGLSAVTLPLPDAEVAQAETAGTLTAVDGSQHPLLSPLSGRVMETNLFATTDPSLVEKDPYFRGWLYRLLPSDPESELKELISCSSDRM